MSRGARCRHIGMTYRHPTTLEQLVLDREASLRHQANVRRRIIRRQLRLTRP